MRRPIPANTNNTDTSALKSAQSNSKKTVIANTSSPTNENGNFESNFFHNDEMLNLTSSVTKNIDRGKFEPRSYQQSTVFNSNELIDKLSTSDKLSESHYDSKKEKKKMTREERKMEAIMKAFERLEKAEQKKQEVQARNAQRKEASGVLSDNDEQTFHSTTEKFKHSAYDKGTIRRKRRKGRTRSTSSFRHSQLHSAESDFTSGDENHLLQSSLALNLSENKLREPTVIKCRNSAPGSVGHLNLSTSDLRLPTCTASRSTPTKSPSADSNSSQGSLPSTPLSSACLLVAAAVGPLAPGFKFPKTKKLLMNEWLREAPEQSVEFSCTSKNLASLASLDNTANGNCDSSPQRVSSQMSGSAKKRWLRQAISEECDSPGSPGRPESPHSEMLAPPKKRRTARESLSSDNYTPPTTPTMLSSDNLSLTPGKSFCHEVNYHS